MKMRRGEGENISIEENSFHPTEGDTQTLRIITTWTCKERPDLYSEPLYSLKEKTNVQITRGK